MARGTFSLQGFPGIGNYVGVTIDGSPQPQAESNGLAPLDWGSLLAQHERWLRVVILARTGDAQAVDEILQEVALAAVAQVSPLRAPEKARAWLRKLAILKSIRHRRQLGRRRRCYARLAAGAAFDHDDGQADPFAWLVRDERISLAREALARLPARDTEILLLKYGEKWSYRQLAEYLGLSASAVDARLVRARARLRRELAAGDLGDA